VSHSLRPGASGEMSLPASVCLAARNTGTPGNDGSRTAAGTTILRETEGGVLPPCIRLSLERSLRCLVTGLLQPWVSCCCLLPL
jgi:hypothetical protein